MVLRDLVLMAYTHIMARYFCKSQAGDIKTAVLLSFHDRCTRRHEGIDYNAST